MTNDTPERLVESDSFAHDEGTAGYTLFTTKSTIFPFVKYEQQIAEINDYCVFLLNCLQKKVQEAESEVQTKAAQSPDTPYYYEALDYQYDKFLSWEFLYRDIHQCTMLLLLLAFLESTLNEIAGWFSELANCASAWKKVRNPKVSDYIRQIGVCCNTDLQSVLTDELAYYDDIRKIRNQFVHNEWDQLTERYQAFALTDVIHMISQVLAQIEQSAICSGLLGASATC